MYKDKTQNEKLLYNDALEYCARLIEFDAILDKSEDVREFGENMAIDIRAAKFQIK